MMIVKLLLFVMLLMMPSSTAADLRCAWPVEQLLAGGLMANQWEEDQVWSQHSQEPFELQKLLGVTPKVANWLSGRISHSEAVMSEAVMSEAKS